MLWAEGTLWGGGEGGKGSSSFKSHLRVQSESGERAPLPIPERTAPVRADKGLRTGEKKGKVRKWLRGEG